MDRIPSKPPTPDPSLDPGTKQGKMIIGMTVPNFWLWIGSMIAIVGIILAGFLS